MIFAAPTRKIFSSTKFFKILEDTAAMDIDGPKDTHPKAPAVAAEVTNPVSAAAPPRKGANSTLFSKARLTFLSS